MHSSSIDNTIVGSNLNFEKIAKEITNLRVLLESFINQKKEVATFEKALHLTLIVTLTGISILFFKDWLNRLATPFEFKKITKDEMKYFVPTKLIQENILEKIKKHLESDKNQMINFLLYGPPGTGKTSIAKFIALHKNAYFIDMSYNKIQAGFHGQTAACQNNYFKLIKKLAKKSYVVVLIDECEMACQAISWKNTNSPNAAIEHEINTVFSGLKTFLSTEGDSWVKNVCCILTTNSHYQELSPAILRDGRMKAIIKIDYFSQAEQNTYIESYLNQLKIYGENNLKNEAITTLQDFLPLGISIATINKICDDVSAFLNNKQKTNKIEEIKERDLKTKIHNSYLESTYGSAMIKNTDEKNNEDEKYKYFLYYQIYQLLLFYILDKELFENKFIYLTNYWLNENEYSYIYFDKNFSHAYDSSIIQRNFSIKILAKKQIETDFPRIGYDLINTDIQQYQQRYPSYSFNNTSNSLLSEKNQKIFVNLLNKILNKDNILFNTLKEKRFIFKKELLHAIKD